MWKRRTLEKEESIGEVWRRTEKKGGGEGCWGRMLGKNGKEGEKDGGEVEEVGEGEGEVHSLACQGLAVYDVVMPGVLRASLQ